MKIKTIDHSKDRTEYILEDEKSDANIIIYHLFPGLNVSYISIHTSKLNFPLKEEDNSRYIGFHYCKEGRIEQESEEEFFYLYPGDCSVTIHHQRKNEFHFPLNHYHGISIDINLDLLPSKFSDFLDTPSIEPEAVAEKICGKKQAVILRNVESLTHIFKESDRIAEEYRKEYLKIKVLELLFVLSKLEYREEGTEEIYIPRSQAELVKKIADYISEHINEKISLHKLTSMFGISESHLQNIFKRVYGMTVASFIRVQKMHHAAQVLIQTDRSIDDIAEEFGYINESKFSSAFKKIMGDTPSVYRREHTKIKIN